MTAWLLPLAAIGLLAANLASFVMAGRRCRPDAKAPMPLPAPPVSIIIPLAGMEPSLDESLRGAFAIDYPAFELLFCVDDARDPAAVLARRLIEDHPQVDSRLLTGEDPVTPNPKLNNCLKGWQAARHDWIVIADSNACLPRDCLPQLFMGAGKAVPVTFSPPIGARPAGLWAEIECAFLNSLQARILYTADVIGANPVQGKTMLIRRAFLEPHGGLRALACDLAEDIALRKMVGAARLNTRIVDAPFRQLLDHRTAADVLRRQLRWAFLRRQALPAAYPFELCLGGAMPLALAGLAARGMAAPWWLGTVGAAAILYLAELAFVRRMGWWRSWRTPLALLARDALLPGIWLAGLIMRVHDWRGNRVEAGVPGAAMTGETP